MRFLVTLNMPSSNNNLVHLVNLEHNSNSLQEFLDCISNNDFIIAEEFYQYKDGNEQARGKMILNTFVIGKVREYNPNYFNETIRS